MASGPYFVPAGAIESVLEWRDAVTALSAAYARPIASASAPRRTVASDAGGWLRTLPAIPAQSRYFGAKLMGMATAGADPGVEYVTVLYDRNTSKIAAFLDANLITAYRTAATSAAALERMAPAGSGRLGVLGSGVEATMHTRAFAAVRTLEQITVFSPTTGRREAFAASMAAELGVPCVAVDSPQEAVAGATIVLAAARSYSELPILFGDWLQSGAVVVSIGSTVPSQREIDVSVLSRADLIICDALSEVLEESGDVLEATRAGIPVQDKAFSLSDLLQGKLEEALRVSTLSVFKSVGGGFQDIVLGQLVFEKALAAGLARELPIEFSHKSQ